VRAYICWSITSNREWGLKFTGNSDFGLYHVDLDTDPALTRQPTSGAEAYAQIIREFEE
jgi:beta-glucosidase/6-phospho-beta-glucosidase/beta-galactosidase